MVHPRFKLAAWISAATLVLMVFFFGLVQVQTSQPSVKAASITRLIITTITPTPTPLPTEIPRGRPVHLSIAKINVEADIIDVGLTADGNMDVPPTMEEVGWYMHGPRPGQTGSAVLDGHLGVGTRGVFVDLHKLEKGDEIKTTDEHGQVSTFVVREKKTYDKLEHPEEVFLSQDGAHLNLITCQGEWNKSTGTPERLVIFTDLEQTAEKL